MKRLLILLGQAFVDALYVWGARSFNFLGKVIVPVAIQVSVKTGVRPQTWAYVFLMASVALEIFSQLRYALESGPFVALWSLALFFHYGVMAFFIETARRFLERMEDTGSVSMTASFPMAISLSQLWTLVSFYGLAISLVFSIGHDPFHRLQILVNLLDLLCIGFTWTLMLKPPSLWSRIKNRTKDWKPTFAPVPQGV